MTYSQMKATKIAERKQRQAERGGPQPPPQPSDKVSKARARKAPKTKKLDDKVADARPSKASENPTSEKSNKRVAENNEVSHFQNKKKCCGVDCFELSLTWTMKTPQQIKKARVSAAPPAKAFGRKPKDVHVSAEEQRLEGIVSNYKKKLFGDKDIKTSRWFE